MYPKLPTCTMKNIAAKVMGKPILFIGIFHSLANRQIVKHENFYTFCPKFNE